MLSRYWRNKKTKQVHEDISLGDNRKQLHPKVLEEEKEWKFKILAYSEEGPFMLKLRCVRRRCCCTGFVFVSDPGFVSVVDTATNGAKCQGSDKEAPS